MNTTTSSGTSIDMLTPTEVCLLLNLDRTTLLAVVNRGELAAYRLGGFLRFRAVDVERMRHRRIVAA